MSSKSSGLIRILLIVVGLALSSICAEGEAPSPQQAQAIAREAYVYGYPLLRNYSTIYSYFIDSSSPQFKAPWNHLPAVSSARPTPNERPASPAHSIQFAADLRTEPLVLPLPKLQAHRQQLVQELELLAFDGLCRRAFDRC